MASVSSSDLICSNFSFFGFMTNKLDRDNYSLWVAQLVPIILGSDLMGFIDGSNPCPLEYVLDAASQPTKEKNPDFRNWIKQDQNILGILNNTLSSFVFLSVCQHKTSRDVWVALENRYASQSRNRVLELRRELLRTTRDDSTISDFLDKINNVAHRLALAGKPVDEDDLITIIMQNVGPAYEVTGSSAQARDMPITYHVLVALLLSTESRLKTHMTASVDHHVTTSLFAPKQHRNGGNKKDGRNFGNKSHTSSGNKSGSILGQPKQNFNTRICSSSISTLSTAKMPNLQAHGS